MTHALGIHPNIFKDFLEKQMQSLSLHRQFNAIAKQAGFMPTYWSCVEISLGNDRTPGSGSGGTVV